MMLRAARYPDCSEAFNDAWAGRSMRKRRSASCRSAFLGMSKADVVRTGLSLRFHINIPGVAMKAANIPAAYALPASIGQGPLNSTEDRPGAGEIRKQEESKLRCCAPDFVCAVRERRNQTLCR